MRLSWIAELLSWIIGYGLAFWVALLPERIKEQEPFRQVQSCAAHVLSGIFECLCALVLFLHGYDQFVGGLSRGIETALAAPGVQAAVAEGELRGVGVYGYILYLMHPIALISFYLFIEGSFRAFAAGTARRCHGIAAFWIIDRITLFIGGKRNHSRLRRQLGPEEPDALSLDDASGSLVLLSVENKDWRERQVAQHKDVFYVLAARDFVPGEGRYSRYRYIFRPMLPGEIIRGRIVRI